MCITAIDGAAVSIPAYTANISRTGILFQCARDIEVGHRLDYVIDLYPDCSVQLRGKGRVVRWAAAPSGEQPAVGYLLAVTLEAFECIRSASVHGITLTEQYV